MLASLTKANAHKKFHKALYLIALICICYGITIRTGFFDIFETNAFNMDLYHFPTPNKTKMTEYPSSIENLFIRFGNNKGPQSLKCNTCALVASSGMLLYGNAGKEIDSNDCVIRMNDAPTNGYEKDVGSKTTIRVFNLAAKNAVFNYLRTHEKEQSNTILVLVATPRAGDKTLRKLLSAYRDSILYCYDSERLAYERAQYEYESGFEVGKSWISCGWRGLRFASDICGKINVYGMLDESYCKQVFMNVVSDVSFHYYHSGFLGQCFFYEWNQNGWTGYRYFTEKRIFKKWARESGHIEFIYPRLNLFDD